MTYGVRVIGIVNAFVFLAVLCGGQASAGTADDGVGPATKPEKTAAATSIFGDWRMDRPGRRHRITPADLPPPYASKSAGNSPHEAPRPKSAKLSVPDGFTVGLFAEGLDQPRALRAAPNGDIFVSETASGNVRVLRPSADGGSAATIATFARDLSAPFGIAFYPAGPDPKWVYIAEENRVIRFSYTNGDLAPRSAPETIVAKLATTTGGHVTRDVAFSKDGARMFVSVGSETNVAEGMKKKDPEEIQKWEAEHGLGAAWGSEESRANVLVFTPEGKERRAFATGLRNCVGLAVHPETGDLYCSTNERDGLGDNLVPDYVTRVREGDFFGWPWRYMGDHEDPRWKGARSDLAGKVANPDVPIQPHSAPLEMTFYTGTAFPPDYRGSAFVALHGSWNRSSRTGYKVVRIIMRDGQPTGEYEDFLTGFVVDSTSFWRFMGDSTSVWGRPVGVATARDGSLLVSEDANGAIWRVAAAPDR